MIRIHRVVRRTCAEGPGVRFCIWTQGCAHQCPGCFARDTWDPQDGEAWNADEVIAAIRQEAAHIEGITLLGGEPFDQAAEMAEVAEAARRMGLSVMAFTGYTHEQLRQRADAARLLAACDLLADGPYIEALRSFSRPWVGSSNQRFVFLTDRYDESILACGNRMELRVGRDGALLLNGMGELDKLQKILCSGLAAGERGHRDSI